MKKILILNLNQLKLKKKSKMTTWATKLLHYTITKSKRKKMKPKKESKIIIDIKGIFKTDQAKTVRNNMII